MDNKISTKSEASRSDDLPQAQYIQQENSLRGLGGLLVFWLIVFGMYSVSFLFVFFFALASIAEDGLPSGTNGALAIETMIFGLLICVSYILTVVFIAMQKKLGRLLAFISIGLTALYAVIMSITGMFAQYCYQQYSYGYLDYGSHEVCSGIGAGGIIILIGVILGALIYAGLVSLYFVMSKRVKLTLIK